MPSESAAEGDGDLLDFRRQRYDG